jgi:thiol-disulfide isomerase/thioredoxin
LNYLSMESLVRRRTEVLLVLLTGLLSAPAIAQGRGFTPMADVVPAPRLVLTDLDDTKVDLAALRGRVVVVNFWATWCPPCRREFPSLGRLQKLFKPQDLTVVAVNVGEDADTVFSFAGHTDFPVLLDRDSKAMAGWRVGGLPATFVIDREGRIVLRAVGGREFDAPDILSQLRPLIERKKP